MLYPMRIQAREPRRICSVVGYKDYHSESEDPSILRKSPVPQYPVVKSVHPKQRSRRAREDDEAAVWYGGSNRLGN